MNYGIENNAIALLSSVATANSFKFRARDAHGELEYIAGDYLRGIRIKQRRAATEVPVRDGNKVRNYSAKTLLKALTDLESEYRYVWPLIEDDVLVKVGEPAECEEMRERILSFLRLQKSLVSINGKVGRPSGSELYPIILPLLDIFLKYTGTSPVGVQRGNGGGRPKALAIQFVNSAIDAYGLAAVVKRPRKKTPGTARDIDETIVKALYYWRDMQPTKVPGYLIRLAAEAGTL